MMTVNFKKNWFGPGSPTQRPGEPRILRGRRFRKGLHTDVPEELYPFLPKSAEVVERGASEYTTEVPAEDPKADLHAEDIDRAAGEQEDEVLEAAEEEGEIARKRKAFNEELKNAAKPRGREGKSGKGSGGSGRGGRSE